MIAVIHPEPRSKRERAKKRRRFLRALIPVLIGSVLVGAIWLEALCQDKIMHSIDRL